MDVRITFPDLEKECMLLDISSGNKLAVPVVPFDGKPLKGILVLTAPDGKKVRFSEFEFKASSHVLKSVDANDFELVDRIQIKPPTPLPLLDADKDYTLDGNLELPFEVPAGTFAKMNSFGGEKMALYHTLELHATTPGMFGRTPLHFTQHLSVQVPAAAPPVTNEVSAAGVPAAAVPWMTVGDCGGEIKLELPTGLVADIHGSIAARISAKGTAPLKRIKLLLLQQECDSVPTLIREEVVWTRPYEEPADELAFEAALSLTGAADLLMPSVPKMAVGSADVEVQHLLRMVAEPVKGKEAWNTMPVRLVRTKLGGQPKGVLPRVSKAKAKGDVEAGVPWRLLFFLLAFLFVSTYGIFSLYNASPQPKQPPPPPRPHTPKPPPAAGKSSPPALPKFPEQKFEDVFGPLPQRSPPAPKIVVPDPSPEPERPRYYEPYKAPPEIRVPQQGELTSREIRDRLMKMPAFRAVQDEHGQFLKDLMAKIHEHPQMLLDLEKEQKVEEQKKEEAQYGMDPEAFAQMGKMPDLKEEADKIMNMDQSGGMGM